MLDSSELLEANLKDFQYNENIVILHFHGESVHPLLPRRIRYPNDFDYAMTQLSDFTNYQLFEKYSDSLVKTVLTGHQESSYAYLDKLSELQVRFRELNTVETIDQFICELERISGCQLPAFLFPLDRLQELETKASVSLISVVDNLKEKLWYVIHMQVQCQVSRMKEEADSKINHIQDKDDAFVGWATHVEEQIRVFEEEHGIHEENRDRILAELAKNSEISLQYEEGAWNAFINGLRGEPIPIDIIRIVQNQTTETLHDTVLRIFQALNAKNPIPPFLQQRIQKELYKDWDNLKQVCSTSIYEIPDVTSGILTIKGHGSNVFLSETAAKIRTQLLTGRIKEVHILPKDTLSIDTPALEFPGLNLVLLGPNINVIGTCRIDVSGIDGAPIRTQPGVPENRLAPGTPGSNGNPGNPGEFAGNVLIQSLKSKITGLDMLTIRANGGSGSRGQDGGNGEDGKDGKPGVPGKPITKPSKANISIRKYFHAGRLGEEGKEGGLRGEGGIGGSPGSKGTISVISAGERITSSEFTTVDGARGDEGKPGNPGIRGVHGLKGNDVAWTRRSMSVFEEWKEAEGSVVKVSKIFVTPVNV
jgi:hypothetical protein